MTSQQQLQLRLPVVLPALLSIHLRTGIFGVVIYEQLIMTSYFRTATPAVSVTVFGSARSIIFTNTD
jgi:hypothetical protein